MSVEGLQSNKAGAFPLEYRRAHEGMPRPRPHGRAFSPKGRYNGLREAESARTRKHSTFPYFIVNPIRWGGNISLTLSSNFPPPTYQYK